MGTKADYDAARPDMDKALEGAEFRSVDSSMEIYRGSPSAGEHEMPARVRAYRSQKRRSWHSRLPVRPLLAIFPVCQPHHDEVEDR